MTIAEIMQALQSALVARYAIQRVAGEGGMAIVFVARDLKLGRDVALKVLRPELAGIITTERFLREVAISARLTHPNIVPVYDSGDANGLLYYVMPFIEGESLRDRLERTGPMPTEEVARIVREVAEALSAAHTKGVVHRDVKPGNILLSRGQALVADFGIAQTLSEGDRLTETGISIGTPAYLSPEQASGQRGIDGRADQYSLACVAYEMLVGEPPFAARSSRTLAARHLFDTAPPIRSVRPGVPAAMEHAVLRGLAKTPADRWPDIASFAAALDVGRRSEEITAPMPHRWRPSRQQKVIGLVLTLGAVIIGTSQALVNGGLGDDDRVLDPSTVAVLPFDVTNAGAGISSSGGEMASVVERLLAGTDLLTPVSSADVLEAWRRVRRGTGPVSQREMAALAKRVGASHVLRGHILVTGDSVVASASLQSMVALRELVVVERIAGQASQLGIVLERVAKELLIRTAGEPPSRLTTLVGRSPEALKAYLSARMKIARGRYKDAKDDLQRAVASDSNFAEAGISLYLAAMLSGDAESAGEGYVVAVRHRDRLSYPDQRVVQAMGSPPSPALQNYAGMLRVWGRLVDSVSGLWESEYTLGEMLYQWGPAIGNHGAHLQSANLFRRILVQDSGFAPALERLIDVAASAGESTEVRRLGQLYLSRNPRADERNYVRWRVASSHAPGTSPAISLLGDSATKRALEHLVVAAQTDAIALTDAFQASQELLTRATTLQDRWSATELARQLALNRGRASDRPAEIAEKVLTVPAYELYRVVEALYWEADSTTADSIVADRARLAYGAMPAVTDPSLGEWMDMCTVGLWSAAVGQWARVRESLSRLQRVQIRSPRGRTNYIPICIAILDAQHTADRRDPRARMALEHLDSILTARPATNAHIAFAGNVVAARLHEQAGNFSRALAAVQRRTYSLDQGAAVGLSTLLREEGRLAERSGQREVAIRAFSKYLALRASAGPEYAEQINTVRGALTRLMPDKAR